MILQDALMAKHDFRDAIFVLQDIPDLVHFKPILYNKSDHLYTTHESSKHGICIDL